MFHVNSRKWMSEVTQVYYHDDFNKPLCLCYFEEILDVPSPFFILSLSTMLHVKFKKWLYHLVAFRGLHPPLSPAALIAVIAIHQSLIASHWSYIGWMVAVERCSKMNLAPRPPQGASGLLIDPSPH